MNLKPTHFVRCLAVVLLGIGALTTQGAELAGLKVGEKAPAFELKDASGKTITLSALQKNGPVAIVFYRSADW